MVLFKKLCSLILLLVIHTHLNGQSRPSLCEQYGTVVPDITIQSGTLASQLGVSGYTGKKIRMIGLFEVDIDFTFTNCILEFVNPAFGVSQINIIAGSTNVAHKLTIDDCKAYTCNGSWEGIDTYFQVLEHQVLIKYSQFENNGHIMRLNHSTFELYNSSFRLVKESPFLAYAALYLTSCRSFESNIIYNCSFVGYDNSKMIYANDVNMIVDQSYFYIGGTVGEIRNSDYRSFLTVHENYNELDFSIVNSNFISNDCSYNNSNKGIDFNSGKLTINNANFNTIATNGVSIKRGEYEITGSTFSNMDKGILITKSAPTIGFGTIQSNTFLNTNIDIHSTGASIEGMTLDFNNFSGKDYGILFDGDNSFKGQRNTFINSYAGSIMNANGSNNNLELDNQFTAVLVGLQSQGSNHGFQFLRNCFSTAAGDAYLSGTVNDFMGDKNISAGNCFTKNGVPDLTATTNDINYFRVNENNFTCTDPVSQGTILEKDAILNDGLNCGSGTSTSPSVRWNYCYPITKLTCAEIDFYLAQVNAEILLTQNDVNTSPTAKAGVLKYLGRCRQRLQDMFNANCLIVHIPDPDDHLDGGKKRIANHIGVLIDKNQLTDALIYLNAVVTTDEELQDFITVQRINIAHLSSPAFSLSLSDRNILTAIGNKYHPLSAYGRGLLYELTGELITPTIGRISDLGPRSRIEVDKIAFDVSPNPVINRLVVQVNDSDMCCEVIINDLYGRKLLKQELKFGSCSIDLSNFNAGLYILSTLVDGEILTSCKIMKQ